MSEETRFSDIGFGETKDVTFLVTELEGKVDKKGSDFCVITASDGEQDVTVRIWGQSLDSIDFDLGDVITASITNAEYNGGRSYSFRSWNLESRDKAVNYIRMAPLPVSLMWGWILSRTSEMREPYRSLIEDLVISREERYCHASAARSNHHDYVSGLLYHSYRMARAADVLAPIYDIDADLAVCGSLVHDIGKLEEMDTDVFGNVEYTISGQMKGHLLIGCQMVRDAAKRIGWEKFDSDELVCLEHIIASHHGLQEMGAIKEPVTKEAILVSALDMLDMKLTVYDEEAKNVVIGNMSPNYNNIIGKIYVPASTSRARIG